MIARCNVVAAYAARCKFKDMCRAPASACAPWLQRGDAAQYLVVAVQVDDIDGLAHEGAVDAVAFREQ